MMNLDIDWSPYRWVTEWQELRPEFINCRLAYGPFLIPQCVREDNAYDILYDINENLADVCLHSLAVWVHAFDLQADSRNDQPRERISYVDEDGNLTPHYRRGMEILKRVQREQPELLPVD